MGLTLPTPSVTIGPAWATQLNAAIRVIEEHDHFSVGTRVPVAGVKFSGVISTERGTSFIGLDSVGLFPRALSLDTANSIWVNSNGDLYYRHAAGNVQLTSGAAINAAGLSNAIWTPYVTNVNTSIDPGASYSLIEAQMTGGADITITLPSPVTAGKFYWIRRQYEGLENVNSTQQVVISCSGGSVFRDYRGGAQSSVVLTENGETALVVAVNSTWIVYRNQAPALPIARGALRLAGDLGNSADVPRVVTFGGGTVGYSPVAFSGIGPVSWTNQSNGVSSAGFSFATANAQTSGGFTVALGNGSTTPGAINLVGGAGTGATVRGGDATLRGGNSATNVGGGSTILGGTGAAGGLALVQGGQSTGAGAGGNAGLEGGFCTGSGNGGDAIVLGGTGTVGGAVTIEGGDGDAGGDVTISGGTGGATTGGTVYLLGGEPAFGARANVSIQNGALVVTETAVTASQNVTAPNVTATTNVFASGVIATALSVATSVASTYAQGRLDVLYSGASDGNTLRSEAISRINALGIGACVLSWDQVNRAIDATFKIGGDVYTFSIGLNTTSPLQFALSGYINGVHQPAMDRVI